MNLHPDWKNILQRAWSSRLLAVAAGLTGAEAVLTFMMSDPPLAPLPFAVLLFTVTVSALVARVIAQRGVSG